MKVLEIKTALQIQKNPKTVYEAIIEPAHMVNYFISKSSGRMEAGKELVWNFPEFSLDVALKVVKTQPYKLISYFWIVEGEKHLVEISLIPEENDSTLVHITENGRANDDAGIKWLVENTAGWANFLACLKAYLEYGINLRKGGFDFLRNTPPIV
ncbi:MAG: SRPBCC domain-containing protein [Brumimicrobium sp.]|nr:SRPBCC domain-containing protein [Brumimicrobium sp.]